MSRLLSVMLLVASVSLSQSSAAAVIDLGTLNTGFNSLGVNFVPQSSFSDTFNFQLGELSDVAAGVASLKLSFGNVTYTDISGLNLEIFDASHISQGSGLDFTLASRPAGSYYALVTGVGTGVFGGGYAGGITVSAAPVPEPETWGMVLAGLGLLGYAGRRRKAANERLS